MKKLMTLCFVMLFALSIVNAHAVKDKAKKSVSPVLKTPVFSKQHKTYKPPLWAKEQAALDKLYQVEEFRLFYTTDGKHALPKKHQEDKNKNNTPDYIEDIAAQLVTAKYIYLNVLELKHPFEGNRYKNRVKYFDVNIGALPFGINPPVGNGSAGSKVVKYYRPNDPEGGIPVLTIDIKNTIDVTNLTPAHELFHQFQYGYTMFKNKWYLEGMARLSEYLFKSNVPPTTNFPSNIKARNRLFKQSYDACSFWQMVFASIQNRRDFKVPEKIKQRKYITVNRRIMEGCNFSAVHAFKFFLQEYDKVDDEVSKKAGLNPIIWNDSIQKSDKNNKYLWLATLRVYKKLSYKHSKLRKN